MSQALLPKLSSEPEFEPLLREAHVWRPAIEAICLEHGLASEPLEPFDTGSSVLWAIGQTHVIKLMPPFWARDCAIEIQVLNQLSFAAELPVPQLLGQGQLEGWPYFIMNRLPGRFCSEVWSELTAAQQTDIIRQLGQVLKALHQLPITDLNNITVAWPEFVQAQVEGFARQQMQYGVKAGIIDELEKLLWQQAPGLRLQASQSLMHCEVMPEHLLLIEQSGQWKITGLIDFGDPMVGFHEYEFGAVCVFFAAQRPDLLREFLLAYGYRQSDLTFDLSQRLCAAALLHRFGTVPLGIRKMATLGINTDAKNAFFETFFSL